MPDALATYGFLAYIMAIVSSTLGLFLLLSSVSENVGLKPYYLSRRVLAIAYFVLGVFYTIDGVMIGSEPGDEDLFLAANVSLGLPLCQAYLFTYALIILIEPSFALHKWNRVQQVCIVTGCVSIITGFFLGIRPLQYVLFFMMLTFYLYQLICYTRLFLKKKKMYISRVENYFSGNEISWLRWVDVAFFSALIIGIGALFSVIIFDMRFNIVFILICGVFYFAFALKYLEYPKLFEALLPVIKEQHMHDSNMEDDRKLTTEKKLEEWIKEKRFMREGISMKDLAQELDVKQSTISFYINVHLQMNFKSWLLYLKEKEQQMKLKKTQSKFSELFARIEQLMQNEQLYLDSELSRDEIAKKLFTNMVYVSAAIKEKTNMSFGEYINSLRLDYAHNLLSDPQKDGKRISDIAIESGFKSQRTFNRAFKNRFGFTPGKAPTTCPAKAVKTPGSDRKNALKTPISASTNHYYTASSMENKESEILKIYKI